jgi:hypothetical protein
MFLLSVDLFFLFYMMFVIYFLDATVVLAYTLYYALLCLSVF